jgi:hypothetical protein
MKSDSVTPKEKTSAYLASYGIAGIRKSYLVLISMISGGM